MTGAAGIVSTGINAEVDARGVATVTLDRATRANAYDYSMLAAIAGAFARFSADESVRAIVLRGNGRHFCAGADISAGSEPDEPGLPEVHEIFATIEATTRPTLAVVQGACVGGGLALAAVCDIVIASTDAFFSLPEVRLGLSPGPLSLPFARATSLRALRRYGITGQRFDAHEALRIGLAQRLVDRAETDAALAGEIEQILLAAPRASINAKRVASRLAPRPDDGFIDALQSEFLHLRQAAEADEGAASFREKRPPKWYPGEPHA
jgi:methylglutaconyl-CoA hydratase